VKGPEGREETAGDPTKGDKRDGDPLDLVAMRRTTWPWRRIATAVAVGLVLVSGGMWAGSHIATTSSVASHMKAVTPSRITATVSEGVLQSSITVSGVVQSSGTFNLNVGTVSVAGAVPIVTSPPPVPGSTVAAGSVVAWIAGEPIFVLGGTTPMYRDIAAGMSGADVQQIQVGLETLGFQCTDPTGVFGASTQAAIQAFWRRIGYQPPVAAIAAAAASSTAQSSDVSVTPSTNSPSTAPVAEPIVIPQWQVIFVPELPAQVISVGEQLGQTVTNPALVVSQGSLAVSIQLTQGQTDLVAPGNLAALRVGSAGGGETQSSKSYLGRVVSVTPTAGAGTSSSDATGSSQSTSPGGSTALPTGSTALPTGSTALVQAYPALSSALAGAKVQVTIVVQQTAGPVLSVPVTSLVSLPDGSIGVRVVKGGQIANVQVVPGLSIGGEVQVTPTKGVLIEGQKVIVQ